MFLVLFAEITYITLIAIFMEKEAFLQKRTPYDFICYKILLTEIYQLKYAFELISVSLRLEPWFFEIFSIQGGGEGV